ncbi:MAG: sigma 54-interacting transcriptional regulator [Deltaproteobacteria bacterium]|nr:sigma 54-interacting transcriptional regulator [Deltaproteobacteria bacterium]
MPGARGPLPLRQIAVELASVTSSLAALEHVIDAALDATGADLGALMIVRPNGSHALAAGRARGGAAAPNAEERIDRDVIRAAVENGRVVCASPDPPRLRRARTGGNEPPMQTLACVPIAVGGRVHGALCLAARSPRTLTGAQLHGLSLLAGMTVAFLVGDPSAPWNRDTALDALVGESASIAAVRRLIEKVAPTDLTVLVLGETGTGKEVTARALHELSDRRARPLVALNCSAVPEGLLEAELFGARRGSFTGASYDREGRVEAAHESTLFLDEVGDMPLPMQAALLRVLEERAVVRIGETQPRPVDFRLIAATNKNLDAEVSAGRFREDLLFRLREVTLGLPALRDRESDVLLLARLFLHQTERGLGLPVHTITPRAEQALLAYRWPGNVRELRAVMRRAAVLAERLVVTADDLALPLETAVTEPASNTLAEIGSLRRPLAEARDDFVSRYVAAVLADHGGDRRAAAEALGISLRSLYRYIRE